MAKARKVGKAVRKRRAVGSKPSRSTVLETRGEAVGVSIEDLLLDDKNPRLPEELVDRSQDSLLEHIATEYHPIEIARSISAHGYFPSEPLIVVRSGKKYVAVEGNRRLVALKLLQDPKLASRRNLADADEWSEAAKGAVLPAKIPCIQAVNRKQVAPIIGYRHISGIEPWDPWAKARFVASLVDDAALSFDQVASEVGENERIIRENYRNYRVTKQTGRMGVDTTRIRAAFGVFTRAMQDPGLREFIGAVPAADIKRGKSGFKEPRKSKPRVLEFFRWVFGDEEVEPLFTDSRKLSDLALVVSDKPALRELRATGNLEAAFSLAGGIRGRLLTRLTKAASYLESAQEDFHDYVADPDVALAASRCRELAAALE